MLRLPMLSVGWEEVERRRLHEMMLRPEANDVFKKLRWKGVKVDCDSWRSEGIHAIESVLNKYKECCWHFLICSIAMATRRELVKSKAVIDVKLIREVVEYLEKDDDDDDDDECKSDSESDDDGKSDSESEMDDIKEEHSDAEEEEEIDDLKDEKTRQQCIEDLLERCSKMGFSVKKGQEQQILDLMIPYLRGSLCYFMAVKFFMKRVSEYINRSCTLDDLDTLKCALNSKTLRQYDSFLKEQAVSSKEEDEADAKDQVHQQLKKNIVPTKEQGIATPMNQLKQEEKRKCGDIMKFEQCETATPLNLPEQEENMGNVYSCLGGCMETEEWGIATRGGANKRKLAQL
ncbi:hypothetical protein M0R45_023094 [Rubus argutus]|uniref:Uncharacterized protein n=1 Tax=Rubus argutus TaxID=59490 RepID=A0AAW1WQC1_RUBAR